MSQHPLDPVTSPDSVSGALALRDAAALAEDIPLALATAAHLGTSMTPDTRGAQERANYVAMLLADLANLEPLATTDDKLGLLFTEFERYRRGLRGRWLAHLQARSRCLSVLVTGPSRFPTRRNHKRNATADCRARELIDFRHSALAAIRKRLTPELQPIFSGDGDAVERLRAKLIGLERQQLRMRQVNAAIRHHKKDGQQAQVRALVELGLGEQLAVTLLEPDFLGRVGYADYELKNNGAQIRATKVRLAQVASAKAEPVSSATSADGGIQLEDCPADNRVRLFFAGKPDASTRAALKQHGFRWAPSLGCWQAYRNTRALSFAHTVTR